MPLTVQKLPLSRYRPWHVVLMRGEGRAPEVQPFTPSVLLAHMETVGDWDAYATWTSAQQQAALAILAASPSEQAKDARLRRRGRHSWFREDPPCP